MKKYEYRVIEMDEAFFKSQKDKSFEDFLNELGLNGWELCCQFPRTTECVPMDGTYFFKRELS